MTRLVVPETNPSHPLTPALAPDNWYTTVEIARVLRVNPASIRRWRTARPPQGPPFVRLSGRSVLYRGGDVQQWLDARRVAPGQGA
ncbi:helix-turn-helix domain-containing protein [Streptantibioticus parmotrematis]|uniref:helix-turn-helix transcriptional regulator n=1 Tax=Streptantibioticus parmotrematis TaxID=2873249 RepID=UPI0033CC2667